MTRLLRVATSKLQYHAAYYNGDDGWVVAMMLDFPGAMSQGKTLRSSRKMVRDALRMLAEAHIEAGEPLPTPMVDISISDAIFAESIELELTRT
ncbi:MAG: type II toxin-antitoxin system HicB family antitoxin [Gemmataceae bacterium]|nr:type II toxin-antitoxin system HicB family antitoxin [Gemmataceae bacterium]